MPPQLIVLVPSSSVTTITRVEEQRLSVEAPLLHGELHEDGLVEAYLGLPCAEASDEFSDYAWLYSSSDEGVKALCLRFQPPYVL